MAEIDAVALLTWSLVSGILVTVSAAVYASYRRKNEAASS